MLQLVGFLNRAVPLIVGMISSVETIFKAIKGKSAEKKEAYVEGLMTALGVTELLTNKDLLTEEEEKKLKELAGNVADNLIGMSNFIQEIRARQSKKESQ